MRLLYLSAVVFFVLGCAKEGAIVELEGVVKLKGTAKHPYVVVADSRSDKRYWIQNPHTFALHKRQLERLRFKLKVGKKSLPYRPTRAEVLEVQSL